MKHLLAPLLLLLGLGLAACASRGESEPTPWLEAAIETGIWLRSVGVDTEAGRTWPADPVAPESVPTNLYAGSAGVVLFFLDLDRATGDAAWVDEARAGADHLLASLPDELAPEGEGAGLYTGVAGIGFVLGEVHRATGDEAYAAGVRRCLALLEAAAKPAGPGVEWSRSTDVISGSAGIGLWLLHAAERHDEERCVELAAAAGRRLLELAIPTEIGAKWAMDPEFPRLMPNFSHGTAGIAFFLARLHEVTGEQGFLDGALAGGEYLLSIADARGFVFHHETIDEPGGGGEALYYLGWCHGPPGTARLFRALHAATGDERWRDAERRGAAALIASGIPPARPEGFWNNVGRCCGSAGVAEFLLEMHATTGREKYRSHALYLTEDLLARGERTGTGLRWIHAEHRTRPELLAAQTGLMQGAAGIGRWLLRLHAVENHRAAPRALPDDPR